MSHPNSKHTSSNQRPNPLLLNVFWFVKVALMILLVVGIALSSYDMYVMIGSQDAKGKNHRILVIITFAIAFFKYFSL